MEEKIYEIFSEFETNPYPIIREDHVKSKISGMFEKDEIIANLNLHAEYLAFSFSEKFKDGNQKEVIYCPKWTNGNEEFPSANTVTIEMINYWQKRVSEVNHPLLKARYSGLVIELGKSLFNTMIDINLVDIHISSILNIVDMHLYKFPYQAKLRFARALDKALKFQKLELIAKIKNSVLRFDEENENDARPDVALIAYELLMKSSPKSKNLSEIEEQSIIDRLNNRISYNQASHDSELSPNFIEKIATELIKYYHIKKSKDKIKNLIDFIYYNHKRIFDQLPALNQQSIIERLGKMYGDYGFKDERDRVLSELNDININVLAEMQPITNTFEINMDEFKPMCEEIFSFTFEQSISRIISQIVNSKEQIKNAMSEVYQEIPLLAFIPNSSVDETGRTISKTPSIREDIEKNIISFYVKYKLPILTRFLRKILEYGINHSKISVEILDMKIQESFIYNAQSKDYLKTSISYYFSHQHFEFISTIIPFIEKGLREIVVKLNCNILKISKNSTTDVVLLGDLIFSEAIVECFGEDIQLFLSIILNSNDGLNLRNIVCHGLSDGRVFQPYHSDLLFIILCLLLEVKPVSENISEEINNEK